MLEVLRRAPAAEPDEEAAAAAPADAASSAAAATVAAMRGRLQATQCADGEKRFVAIKVRPSFV